MVVLNEYNIILIVDCTLYMSFVLCKKVNIQVMVDDLKTLEVKADRQEYMYKDCLTSNLNVSL